MKEYKYVSNKFADDGNELIVPDPEKPERSARVGEKLKLTVKEFETLSERFNLKEMESGDDKDKSRESAKPEGYKWESASPSKEEGGE